MYLINETAVTIERMNELDRFKLYKHSTKMWAQANVEFFLDEIMSTRPNLLNSAILRISDILILSGEKLKAWSST